MPWGALNCLIGWLPIIYYVINGAFSELDLAKNLKSRRKILENIVHNYFQLVDLLHRCFG